MYHILVILNIALCSSHSNQAQALKHFNKSLLEVWESSRSLPFYLTCVQFFVIVF